MTTEENDSAFDLSLSSQPELQCPEMDSPDSRNGRVHDHEIVPASDDEFADENLEKYGIAC